MLKQLVEDHDAVPDSLQALYERHCDYKTSPALREIAEALKTTVASHTKTFLIVDGLDECSDEIRWSLVEQLQDFRSTVYIMLTSRFLDHIEEELEDFEQAKIEAHKSDIELFIDRQIRKNRNLQRVVRKNPALRDDIKEGVINTAENMY